jgi:Arm DNA-binding domain
MAYLDFLAWLRLSVVGKYFCNALISAYKCLIGLSDNFFGWNFGGATMALKLTKRTIDALAPRAKAFIAWDLDIKGFGVRVMPSGAKTFVLEYRPGEGGRGVNKQKLTLGRYGSITVEQARKAAQDALARVRLGGDPQAEKMSRRAALTMLSLTGTSTQS